MASFFVQLLQPSVIQLCRVCFFTVSLVNTHKKKTRQNAAEILRSKHSIFVLATVTFDRGQEL